MSRLIRDEEKNGVEAPVEGVPLLLPLSSSAVVAHLKVCQKLAADHAQGGFRSYVKALAAAFNDELENAKSNSESSEWQEVHRLIEQHQAELERYFCGYISEGFVKFKKGQLNTTVGSDVDREQLSLVNNEDLEETIAISSVSQRADAFFAEPLWALNQRFAVLNGGEHVTEASNPAAPIQFCESLRKALKLLHLNSKVKQVAYKIYDDELLKIVSCVNQGINEYLKAQGVLPHLKYSIPSGNAPESALKKETWGTPIDADVVTSEATAAYRPDPNLPPEEYQNSLVHAIRGLQGQLVAAPGTPLPAGGVMVSPGHLVGALQALQTGVQNTELPSEGAEIIPLDVSAIVGQLYGQLSTEDEDATLENGDMQTIDLVGMLFEYMLDDENLPDSIKALLSYLHTPFLKVAFIDPGFFEQSEHPARVLLNNMAEAGSCWVGNDGTSQYDIYNKIKNVVDRILKEFDKDIKFITELLLEFSSYTKNIIRRQELMEKRATEKAQGEEKLREVKLRVNEEISGRTEGKELPSAILLFLLQPWSDYLSFALLRYGEKSDRWGRALAVVDDVLWCIEPKEMQPDKNRQIEIYEDLLSAIESGFETIGYDQIKGNKLVDALAYLIKLAVQSKRAEPAPASMRDQLERIAAEKAGTRELYDEQCSPEEEHMVESLKMIEFGTWFEFETGKRLKVAWYNARTSHYMLVDQMGKRVDMMSGWSLAKQMISGSAKIISGSSKPFFERALENIFQKLNEKAEAIKPGDDHETC